MAFELSLSPEEAARLAEGGRLVDAYLRDETMARHWRDLKPLEFIVGQMILDAAPAVQISVLLSVFSPKHGGSLHSLYHLRPLLRTLSRRSLPLTERDLLLLIHFAATSPRFETTQTAVHILEKQASCSPLAEAVQEAANALRVSVDGLDNHPSDTSYFKLAAKLDALLGDKQTTVLKPNEAWGAAVLADLAVLSADERASYNKLLVFALNSEGAKPSQKWLSAAATQMEALGKEAVSSRLLSWFALFVQAAPNTVRLPDNGQMQTSDDYDAWLIGAANANHNYGALKGLVWCCRNLNAETVAPALGDLAWAALKKIPGLGAQSSKVGNACILTLGAMPGTVPIGQLSRLKTQVKYPVSLRMIETALADAAARAGLPPEELEELAVPTLGLDANGCLREEFGAFGAQMTLTGRGREDLRWTDAAGKVLKSVPAEVTREHGEALKVLKRTADEINKILPVQRERLEQLLLSGRSWTVGEWRERYLNHPLLGCLSKRLIWRFDGAGRTGLGLWENGRIADETGKESGWINGETRVSLWHPLGSAPETVLAWRRHLEERQIVQPFKQAHREVYLLTDAERTTRTYSNRFAGHILRQHQFQALCRQRGWVYRLQGQFDSYNTPTLLLPQHGLKVEFGMEGVQNNGLGMPAIYLYASTGAVAFFTANGASVPLSDTPPLVFSEVMRDVDLFVGVCSAGTDPLWEQAGRYAGPDMAFGDLNASAKTRLDVLSRLVPKLKIAPRCRLDGKFLWVTGALKTYKIHLGSGNVLMEPNDQYLCIVPDRRSLAAGGGVGVFLPFEGDETLALILSKAFLLADDAAIKDPVILAQFRR